MLEDEQKKIITYHRIWFVRLIAMIVACQALKQLICASPLWSGEQQLYGRKVYILQNSQWFVYTKQFFYVTMSIALTVLDTCLHTVNNDMGDK